MDEQQRVRQPIADHQDPAPSYLQHVLPPPNPILSKQVTHMEERINFRLDSRQQPKPQLQAKPPKKTSVKPAPMYEQDRKRQIPVCRQLDKMTLTNGYQPETMLFQKYDNKDCNKRGKVTYFASMFLTLGGGRGVRLPEGRGMLMDDDLVFDAAYQSANLMAVFKVGQNVYDLVLQNDLNTRGFTQWFNFKVQNRRNNFVAKFNIVNLYKTKSLYNMGMKPIVRSERSDKNSKATWRRKGFNIFYQKNELNYQDDDHKFYKTLSFSYDFTAPNDVVQFAHGLPYDLNDLKRLLQSIKPSPRVSISTIGTTCMGKSIPLIKISSTEGSSKSSKKALIVMGRQHPGQTPGSFIGEEIVLQLLRNSKEAEFLIWRFDIYIFPMVNIDGVVLGNYRSNFSGFDLNRSWLRPDPVRQPEVSLIKNYIRKIAKKQQVELILDLHGHSRKMGSFFYGNDYGANYLLFPYIAAKINRNILFEKSKFTRETQGDAKFSTARVVLGNLIKDTGGYVYTYEVSFFGYYKENTDLPYSYTEQHYKQLGKALVQSIYRTFLEIYKQQTTLKESAFFKVIKNELSDFSAKSQLGQASQGGSDSQAEQQMTKQITAIQQFFQQKSPECLAIPPRPDRLEQPHPNPNKKSSPPPSSKELKQLGLPIQRYNHQIKRKIQQLLQKNMQNDLKSVIAQRLPRLVETSIKKHIKSEKLTVQDDTNAESRQMKKSESISGVSLGQQSPPMSYIDYLKIKKQQRTCEDSLKIYGATFGQGRSKEQPNKQSLAQMPEATAHQKQKINDRSFMLSRPSPPHLTENDKSVRSYHTIDLKGYFSMSRQEHDLINSKPYVQKRKMAPNYFMIKQGDSSVQSLANASMDTMDVVAQSVYKIQQRHLKAFSGKGPNSIQQQGQRGGVVKLPLI